MTSAGPSACIPSPPQVTSRSRRPRPVAHARAVLSASAKNTNAGTSCAEAKRKHGNEKELGWHGVAGADGELSLEGDRIGDDHGDRHRLQVDARRRNREDRSCGDQEQGGDRQLEAQLGASNRAAATRPRGFEQVVDFDVAPVRGLGPVHQLRRSETRHLLGLVSRACRDRSSRHRSASRLRRGSARRRCPSAQGRGSSCSDRSSRSAASLCGRLARCWCSTG